MAEQGSYWIPVSHNGSKLPPGMEMTTNLQLGGPELPVFELSDSLLQFMKLKAKSSSNFAVLCMREMFTLEERKNSNISGTRGKFKLDPNGQRLDTIISYVMKVYNITESERFRYRKQCFLTMDQANRNLRSQIFCNTAHEQQQPVDQE